MDALRQFALDLWAQAKDLQPEELALFALIGLCLMALLGRVSGWLALIPLAYLAWSWGRVLWRRWNDT